jgi:hypothetical protein
MEKNKKITVGHIEKLFVDFKGVMEGLELASQKDLTIFVGQNGSGKSLVLIFTWLMGTIVNIFLQSGKSMTEYEKILQFFFDNSFDKNDFTGKMGAGFENIEISFEMDNGKVKNLDINILDPSIEILPSGMPVFMSKTTRLFDDLHKYLKMKKLLNIGDIELSNDTELKKLCEMYKIYDILFIERMIKMFKDPNFKLNPKSIGSFKETLKKEIINVTYDEPNCNFLIHELKDGKTEIYPATIMSSGEQAWVNMFIQR